MRAWTNLHKCFVTVIFLGFVFACGKKDTPEEPADLPPVTPHLQTPTPSPTPSPSPSVTPAPDLIVTRVFYDAVTHGIKVEYKNNGTATSSSTFTIKIVNAGNSALFFESNSLYPFSVPAPGQVTTTGSFPSSVAGPSGTMASIIATVDNRDGVVELDENNNSLTQSVSIP